jgi:NAD(P)-dependent dehydrogenase (short-subunit alcohol dehydrogenase family)
LRDKIILISGSSGIAAATAALAVERGARVFLAGLGDEEGRALATQLGDACAFLHADLSVADSAEVTLAECVACFGGVDALFNVAGISGRRYGDGPLHECSEEGWDATFRHNLKTMFLLSRAVLRHFLPRRRGTVLNMASVSALSPQGDYFATHAYAATKGAVISMTKAMASYYAPFGINVNAIAPGLVRTPMSRRAQGDAAILEFMKTKQPLAPDLLDPSDVARAALFLLSDEARCITGEVLKVDAGWSVS